MITFEQKRNFFDRRGIQKKVGKAQARTLSRGGAATRTNARRSMKKGPKKGFGRFGANTTVKRGKNKGAIRFRKGRYSRPGQAPFYRSSPPNLRTILFAFDGKDSMMIGPVVLPRKRKQNRTVGNIHEFGGRAAFAQRRYGRRAFNYRKRPFMNPAGMKAVGDIRKDLAGSIK